MGGEQLHGTYPNPSHAVIQRVSEDGTSGITTIANLGQTGDYAVDGPPIVSGARVFVIGANIASNLTGLISLSLPNGVGNSAPPFLSGTTVPSNQWLAAWGDDTAVYFGNSAHQWVTCPPAGCTGTPTVLADATSASPYLVGDDQAIYWLSVTTDPKTGFATEFSVMKVAR